MRRLPFPRVLQAAGFAAGLLLPQDVTWQQMRERAKDLAQHAYVERKVNDLPEWLVKLDYDGYRKLRFRPECMLWSAERLPFSVQFHHRGYLFKEKVSMWELKGTERLELRFSPAQFDYGGSPQPDPGDLGYSGFAVRTRFGEPGIGSEFAAFQGASYFRFTPPGQPYGTSVRGLAIDTASDKGEEFPAFVEFWLEKPAAESSQLVVHALLDSPSAAGAYRFAITPGDPTRADVQAVVFARRKIEKLGLAPLTSMFLFGEDRQRSIPDWRPEVHDSDGLLMQTADGTWLWRPLQNPRRTHQIQRFALENPAGFGLLQRDRSFASYEDLESRYERRPSFWVAPRPPWGKGAIELVEIPTTGERNENIVAYWVAEKPVAKGDEIEFGYEVSAFSDDAARPRLARATSVRVGPGEDQHLFVIDFAGEGLGSASDLQADLATSHGHVRNAVVQPNDVQGGVRFSFELLDEGADAVELRVTLRRNGGAVSETLVLPWLRK